MITQRHTLTNAEKATRSCVVWRELLADVLKKGFHGTARVEVTVQDGTIQMIRRRVERTEK